MKKPRPFVVKHNNNPTVIAECDGAGVSSDGSGSWPAAIVILGMNDVRLKDAKRLRRWLDQAIEWLEVEVKR